MTTDTEERWIEAGKILAKDPAARVRCPERCDGVLTVEDSLMIGDHTLIERRLVCDRCGARSVLWMPAAKPGW
jgi:hypothetical protein